MSDLNKWIGSGRLTRDAELRYTPNGTAVTDVTLASNRVWYRDGDKQEETLFVDVTIWGKAAENLAQYLKKGGFVMVEGRLKLDQWTNDKDEKRSKISVVADQVNLGPRTQQTEPEGVAVGGDTPF